MNNLTTHQAEGCNTEMEQKTEDGSFKNSDATVRIKSFYNEDGSLKWPYALRDKHITILVLNGFYFIGEKDAVQCFKCKVILRNLTQDIVIGMVHLYVSPHCNHAWIVTPIQRIKEISEIIAHPREDDSLYETPFTLHHPEYTDFETRLKSFHGHCHKFPNQSPQELADAGFFYTGQSDHVRCYACDGGLSSWEPGELPWIEHVQSFPGCKYCIQKKGVNYVKSFIRAINNKQDIDENSVPAGPVDPIFSPAAQACLRYGFSKVEVSQAIQCCKRKGLVLSEYVLSLILYLQLKNRDFRIRSIATVVEGHMTEDDKTFKGLRIGNKTRT